MNTSKEEKEKQAKDTGLAIILILLIVVYITGQEMYVLSAIATLVLTMTWPAAFRPLSYVWFGFSKILGEIVSRILLSLVFVLVAVPIGFLRNLLGADSMKLKEWKRSDESVFIDKDHTYEPIDIERPY